MARHRSALPQLGRRLFLTDGGIETTLIFQDGLELPDFAAFHLLRSERGTAALRRYFDSYVEVARRHGTGLILESATWRASADWGARLGYGRDDLAEANRRAVALLAELRPALDALVISGAIGPRGDGYQPERMMSVPEAEAYHREQVAVFAESEADMVCAITMNYAEEAAGIARAARALAMPAAISFTVETDGRLPTGQSLADAISSVERESDGYPAYYMINCAHPDHFEGVLAPGMPGVERIRGLRANASRMSHAELNESPTLDAGEPVELGAQYATLCRRLPRLNVLGGCCGTDPRHVGEIAAACAPLFRGTAPPAQPA